MKIEHIALHPTKDIVIQKQISVPIKLLVDHVQREMVTTKAALLQLKEIKSRSRFESDNYQVYKQQKRRI